MSRLVLWGARRGDRQYDVEARRITSQIEWPALGLLEFASRPMAGEITAEMLRGPNQIVVEAGSKVRRVPIDDGGTRLP